MAVKARPRRKSPKGIRNCEESGINFENNAGFLKWFMKRLFSVELFGFSKGPKFPALLIFPHVCIYINIKVIYHDRAV